MVRNLIFTYVIFFCLFNINASNTLRGYFNRIVVKSKKHDLRLQIKNTLVNYGQSAICNHLKLNGTLQGLAFEIQVNKLRSTLVNILRFNGCSIKFLSEDLLLESESIDGNVNSKNIDEISMSSPNFKGSYKKYNVSGDSFLLVEKAIKVENLRFKREQFSENDLNFAKAKITNYDYELKTGSAKEVQIEFGPTTSNIEKVSVAPNEYTFENVQSVLHFNKQNINIECPRIELNEKFEGKIFSNSYILIHGYKIIFEQGTVVKKKLILEGAKIFKDDKLIGKAKKCIIDLQRKCFKLLKGNNTI